MSRYTGRNAQRLIQSKAGFVSVAALLCLSAPARLSAQPTTSEGQQPPATQQTQPQQTPATPAPAPTGQQPPAPPAGQTTTPATPPATTTPASPTTTTAPGTPAHPTDHRDNDAAGQHDAAAARLRHRQPAAGARPAGPGRARAAARPGAGAGGSAGPGSGHHRLDEQRRSGPPFVPGYQASTLGVGRIVTPLLDTPQTVNVVTQQVIREQNAANRARRTAQRRRRHLPRRRRRQPGRHALYPRLLGAERHLPRRRARSGLVHARHVRGRCGRSLQGSGLGAVRPRLDRRRDQSDQQDCRSSATSSKARSPAIPGRARARPSTPTARSTTTSGAASWRWASTTTRRDATISRQNRYGISPSLLVQADERYQDHGCLHPPARQQRARLRHSVPVGRPWGIPRFVAPVPRGNWYGILSGPTAGYRTRHRADRHGEDRAQHSPTTSRSPTSRAQRREPAAAQRVSRSRTPTCRRRRT